MHSMGRAGGRAEGLKAKEPVLRLIGSLSNHDYDLKKTIGLMIKTTALHVHHAF